MYPADNAPGTPHRRLVVSKRLGEGQGIRFTALHQGVEQDAFAVRYRGKVYAYLNRCRHQTLQLDFGDARFFDEAYDALVCTHHGARYRPETGECMGGPCQGGRLTPLQVEERDGEVWLLGD